MMKNPFRVLIITCWILLLLCCIAKLFGANWFIAHTDNQAFIDFCNYVDKTYWLSFIIRATTNVLSCGIYYMAVMKESKFSLSSLLWIVPLLVYAVLKNIFNSMLTLFMVLDFCMMILLPIIIKRNKKTILWSIVGCALVTLFQLISMWLKLNNYTRFDNSVLVGLILSVDYYIMIVLFWLYKIKNNNSRKELNRDDNGLAMV